jgi:uncharacterized protein (DUF3084 family)
MDSTQIMTLAVTLLGSAGAWGFLTLKAKQNHEKALKDDAVVAQFNDTLKEQVDRLATKMDQLTLDKEHLLLEMGEVKAALAEANATIKHLEELLRARP